MRVSSMPICIQHIALGEVVGWISGSRVVAKNGGREGEG